MGKWKFYRSNLPTIVWNASTNTVLADFKQGYFITSSASVANALIGMGYPEVEINSTNPPEVIVNQPPTELIGGLPDISPNMSEKLAEARLSQRIIAPPVVVNKPKLVAEKKAEPIAKPEVESEPVTLRPPNRFKPSAKPVEEKPAKPKKVKAPKLTSAKPKKRG